MAALTLSGANTTTGSVTVSAGTLTVDGSMAAGSTITVANGASLDGSGTINSDVVLLGSATVGGGLTVNGSVTEVPVISSAGTASGSYRTVFGGYTIAASNTPTSFNISAGVLPTGLSLNTGNGLISGTPTVSGVFNLTIAATNTAGTDTKALALTINKATVTPAVTAANKIFDASTTATINSRSLTGVLGGDDAQLTGGTANFDNATAGLGKTVTVTGLGLSGTEAGNYVLSSTTATTTADITATYTLSYNAGSNGSLTGNTAQTVAEGTDGTTVTAVANSGYYFSRWSDASVVNPRTDTAVSASISVTAEFMLDTLYIDGDFINSGILSDATITYGSLLEGGLINGVITNHGTVRNVILLTGGEIQGGTVSGSIKGTPGNQALVNSFISADARLEYIRLGPDTVMHPDVKFGIGVCFESATTIPADSAPDRWLGRAEQDGGFESLWLNSALICGGSSILSSFDILGLGNIEQDAAGRLLVGLAAGRVALWPLTLQIEENSQIAGYSFDANGNVRIDLGDGQVIIAQPALQDADFENKAFEILQLQFSLNEHDNIQLQPWLGPIGTLKYYLTARPDLLALFLNSSITPGLLMQQQPGALPPVALLVFEDENTNLLSQLLLPAPADWPALQTTLSQLPGASAQCRGYKW